MLAILSLIALVAAQMPSDAGEGPLPSPVETSWQLKFEFVSTPMRVVVGGQTYWYILYRITNPTPTAQRFFPLITVVTEDLAVVPTEVGVPVGVFQQIKQLHQRQFRDLMSPTQVIGELKSGEDYSRESVAIWRGVDLSANNFTVYVAGLSGETQLVLNPSYDPAKPETRVLSRPGGKLESVAVNPKHFTVRKTLEIRYTLPGSPQGQAFSEPVRTETRWVMR